MEDQNNNTNNNSNYPDEDECGIIEQIDINDPRFTNNLEYDNDELEVDNNLENQLEEDEECENNDDSFEIIKYRRPTAFKRSFILHMNNIKVVVGHSGYIYLLREFEFIELGENVYKIGMTEGEIYDRINRYPAKSEILLVIPVDKNIVRELESKIIDNLHLFCVHCSGYGTEVFCNNVDIIMDIIIKTINDESIVGHNTDKSLIIAPKNQQYAIKILPNLNIELIMSNKHIKLSGQYKNYIYIVRKRQYVNSGEPIYKIGKSTTIINRMNKDHPTYSEIYLIQPVNDQLDLCENILHQLIWNECDRYDEGRETYIGDINRIIEIVYEVINDDVFRVDNNPTVEQINELKLVLINLRRERKHINRTTPEGREKARNQNRKFRENNAEELAAKQKEHRSKPEVKERNKEVAKIRNSKPEVREKTRITKNAYNAKPENREKKKISDKERRSNPEYKEKRKQQRQNRTEEQKQRERERDKIRRANPEYNAKRRARTAAKKQQKIKSIEKGEDTNVKEESSEDETDTVLRLTLNTEVKLEDAEDTDDKIKSNKNDKDEKK